MTESMSLNAAKNLNDFHINQESISNIEKELFNIINKLLPKTDMVLSKEDNLFEFGCDSITVIELIYQARLKGIKIGSNQVAQYPTISTLAKNIWEELNNSLMHPVPSNIIKSFMLLPNQTAYEYTKSMTICTYLLQPTFKLQKEKLELALQSLVKRHESLRIRFMNESGNWKQLIIPYSSTPILKFIELDPTVTNEERKKIIDEHSSHLLKSFNIEDNCINIRAILFEWGNEQKFFFAIDHYSFDELSMKLFWAELYAAYQHMALPPIPLPYSSIVEELSRLAATWELKEEREFWLKQLSLVKPLPKTKKNITAETNEGIKVINSTITENEGAYHLIDEIPSHYNIQIHEILLAAWIHTLLSWSQLEGVVIYLGTHNRNLIDDMAHTMGCFVTAYPLYLKINNQDNPLQMILDIRNQLKTVPHKGMRCMLSMMVDKEWKQNFFNAPQPTLGFNYLGEEEIKKEMWQNSTNNEIKGKLISVSAGNILSGRHQAAGGIPYLILHTQINRSNKVVSVACDYDSNYYDENFLEKLLIKYKFKLLEISNYLEKL